MKNHEFRYLPIFLILFLLFVNIKLKAQELAVQADTAFVHGDYQKAIKLYKSAIDAGIIKNGAMNENASRCHWNMGRCFVQLNKTDSALGYFKKALIYFRAQADWQNVGLIHTDICEAHKLARDNNLTWAAPVLTSENVKEVYFKISGLKYFDKDSVLIEVNAGSYDGIINNIDAKCIGTLKRDKKTDRTGWILANAHVISVASNKTILKARLYDNTDSLHRVYINDIAAVYCKYIRNTEASLLQELTSLNICLNDNYKTPFYEWREFLDADSLYEFDILEKMKFDVLEIYDIIKDSKDYDSLACDDGLFKGMKMVDALKSTSVYDIRAFLQFVKAFPGKYAGMSHKFAETYATWVINKCPTSAEAMVDYFIHQQDQELKIKYIQNYASEIYKEKYFDAWKNEVLRNIRQYNLESIQLKIQMLKDASYILKNENYKSWYYFCNAKYFQRIKDSTSAKMNFQKALDGFTLDKVNDGVYLCNAALNKQTGSDKVEIVLQNGHAAYFSMNFSPDGKYFVTGSDDKTIKLWDARLGKEIMSVVAHDDRVTSVSFSYDGRYIISASADKTVKLWDADNLKIVSTFNTGITNSEVILSKNSERFIVCGRDSVIQLWSVNENKLLKKFSRHKRKVFDICWGDNENEFYSCGADSVIYKWDIKENKVLRWYREKDRIINVLISPDGRWMANTLANGKIDVWDLNTNKSIYFFNNLKSYTSDSSSFYICEPTFSSDSRYLIYGAKNKRICIMEIITGNYITYNTAHSSDILQIVMSSDGSFFATVAQDFKINLFDFQNYVFDSKYNLRKINIEGHDFSPGLLTFDKNANLLMCGLNVRKFSLITGKSETNPDYINASGGVKIVYDQDKRMMVFLDYYRKNIIRYDNDEKTYDTIFASDVLIRNMDFSFKTKTCIVYDENDYLKVITNRKVDYVIKANLPDSAQRGIVLNELSGNIFLAGYKRIFVFDKKLKLLNKINKLSDTLSFFTQALSGNYLISSGEKNEINIFDVRDFKTIKRFISLKSDNIMMFSAVMSPNDSLLVLGSDDGKIQIWDWRNNMLLKDFQNFNMEIISLAISDDGKYLAASSINSKVVIYDLRKQESVCTLYAMYERGVLTITDSNYYLAPRNCYDGFAFRMNKQIYAPEQFDMLFHRPDLVVKKIGMANEEMINAYHDAYLKRAKRNGINVGSTSLNLQLPVIEIVNKENLPITISQNNIQLTIKASDLQFNIHAIRVWVNNVPLYGIKGMPIKAATDIETNINIPLQSERNIIKVAAVNENGVESLKEIYEVVCNYSDTLHKSKLYLVVISVSKYVDSNYNLTYAAKDGRDLINTFKTKYNEISVDSFINENALKENVLAVKNKLMKSTINDRVIVFVSGHGLLDEQLNFYFATHDIDFHHPEKRGVSYEQINDLLDGIPARQKLLLMDACHSGEVDKDAAPQTSTKSKDTTNEVKQDYARRGNQLLDEGKVGLQNSFELMQDLFSDLSNGNGAVVISAASGTGYALESSAWQNGVFTYSIISGLKYGVADADLDGVVKVSELSEYISREVPLLTKGHQKPTSRAENLEYDWEVW